MAADPSSLVLAEPWRKGTRSGSTGCVEAARLVVDVSAPVSTAAAHYVGRSDGGRLLAQATGEGCSSLI
jgi:hypothetical protein